MRHYALIFLSDGTLDELRKLRVKMIDQLIVDPNSCSFLLNLYKNAKNEMDMRNEIF
jgi:hypothetical protein